jgi:riboflavin biosynthesis pyrimidine reductase
VREFQILFDHGESSEMLDPVYAPYGRLGFPAPPPGRPWIYANFVQTLDGVVSLLGRDGSGAEIAQSVEDRWLMDLLRAHADGLLLGLGTLRLETAHERPRPRGPVFRIKDPSLQQLRKTLRKGREKNIFVSARGELALSDFAAFDGEHVDAMIVTGTAGAARLAAQKASHPQVEILVAGNGETVDLPLAMRMLRERYGVRHLLCEGGPRLYASLLREGLIDEKFLTVSPCDAGQMVPLEERTEGMAAIDAVRPPIGSGEGYAAGKMPHWRWLSCRKAGDHQFHRFRRLTESV